MHFGLAEWLGLAALAVALVFGAPPIFQMLWGRPKITFAFSRVEAADMLSSHLLVHLYNYPVSNRFLTWLGVKREDAHFHVRVIVKDESANQILTYADPSLSEGHLFIPNMHHLHAGAAPVTV